MTEPDASRIADAEARGFARAVQALRGLSVERRREADRLRSDSGQGKNALDVAADWFGTAADHIQSLAPQPPVSDPEEAARERLGKWLAASPFVRTVRRQLHGKPGEISVRVELRAGSGASASCFVGAWCPSEAEAITAALDAAEATGGQR